MEFMMDLLLDEKVLMVQGTGFNWDKPDHFRVVFLPNLDALENAMDRLDRFFANKRQQYGTDNIALAKAANTQAKNANAQAKNGAESKPEVADA